MDSKGLTDAFHWISPELRKEFTNQSIVSDIDSDGCDVKISTIDEKLFFR